MNKETQYICTNCGTIGQPVYRTSPKAWLIILIFFITFVIFPPSIVLMALGLAFLPVVSITSWLGFRKKVCPVCKKEDTMIPLESPMGQKILREIEGKLDKNDIIKDNSNK